MVVCHSDIQREDAAITQSFVWGYGCWIPGMVLDSSAYQILTKHSLTPLLNLPNPQPPKIPTVYGLSSVLLSYRERNFWSPTILCCMA